MRTKKIKFAGLLFAVIFIMQMGNAQIVSIDYFGETPPGDVPKVFAPGIISKPDSLEDRLVFSNDGKWLFYNQRNDSFTSGRMMYMKYENGSWGHKSKASFFEELGRGGNPAFSPDGTRLFFDGGANGTNTYNPYVMELVDSQWLKPHTISIPIPNPSRPSNNVCGPNITDDSTVYFSMQMDVNGLAFDIYRSRLIDGKYELAKCIIKNAGEDCFVARDNSFILLNKYGSDYRSHIFISYRKDDGNCTNPKNAGSKINTNTFEYYPVLSPDYKYLFFSRYLNLDNYDIFWVDTSFIDSLKHTNFIPYLKSPIPDQTCAFGNLFSYQVPDSAFIDDDGNNTLAYSAKLSNGNDLPSWLAFDTITHTFSGTPLTAENISIRVTVTDNKNVSISDNFIIKATPSTEIKTTKAAGEITVFPNPNNGIFKISFGKISVREALVTIYDLQGRLTLSEKFQNTKEAIVYLTGNPAGVYLVKVIAGENTYEEKLIKR